MKNYFAKLKAAMKKNGTLMVRLLIALIAVLMIMLSTFGVLFVLRIIETAFRAPDPDAIPKEATIVTDTPSQVLFNQIQEANEVKTSTPEPIPTNLKDPFKLLPEPEPVPEVEIEPEEESESDDENADEAPLTE